MLTDLAEVALEEGLIARSDQLRLIFQHILTKLPANRRTLTEVLLERGPDTPNAELAEIMKRSESAIKSLKSRTFADLRNLIPVCAEDVGIDFASLVAPEEDSGVGNSEIPSDDDSPA